MSILAMEPPKHADIRRSLAPIIIILRIFGLYNGPLDTETSGALSRDSPAKTPGALSRDSSAKTSGALSRDSPAKTSGALSRDSSAKTSGALSRDSSAKTSGALSRDSPANKLHGLSPTNAWTVPTGARKTWRLLAASRCYSVVLVVALFANSVKFFTTLFSGDSFGLGFKIVVMNWYIQNFCNALCLVVSSWKKSHLSTFYQQWLELFSDPAVRELGLEATDCRKANAAITLTGCVFMLINVTVVFTTMATDQIGIKEAMQHVLTDPVPTTSWGLAIMCSLHIMFSASWTLTNTFVVCICYMIGCHFQRLTAILATHIASSKGAIPPKIRELRMCHLRLCQLLDTCNGFLKLFLAVNYSGTIVASCFLLYQLVNNDATDATTDALNVFWLLANILNAVALSVSLAKMHEAAHEPLESLFRIECCDVSDQTQVLQVQLFISKLTGTQIGASVIDLFIVTKEALLTIAGAYITYFFLLMQFKI